MKRIGIMGGTFDPVHNGHLLLGRQARSEYGLDEIWYMPSHIPPHKKDHRITDVKDRLAMLELALEGFQPDILDSYHVTYRCDCSEERVENMIRSLGKKEVEKLRDEDPIAEVNCQFCNKNYKVDLNELLKKWPASDEKQELEKT